MVVTLRGDLDQLNREALRAELESLVGRGTSVLVELDEVTTLAACAVSELLRARTRVEDVGASLVLCSGPGTHSETVLTTLRIGSVGSVDDLEC